MYNDLELPKMILPYLPYRLNVEVETLAGAENYEGFLVGMDFRTPDDYFVDGVNWKVVDNDANDISMPNGTHQVTPFLKGFREMQNDHSLISDLILLHEDRSSNVFKDIKTDVVGDTNRLVFGVKYVNNKGYEKELTLGSAMGFLCVRKENGVAIPEVVGSQWEMWNEFFSRHYDVFNLIEKGKAKPYAEKGKF